MPRFLHTADLHLNAQRRHFPQQYLKRAQWVLQALEETAVQYKVDCIVVAGDVYDRPDVTNAERGLFSEWLGRLSIPTLIISGNHDARGKIIGDTCLHDLSALRLKRHFVHDGDPTILKAFGCCWLLLPYYGWTDEEFHLIVSSLVWKIRKSNTTEPLVVVMHEAVKGGQTDAGYLVTKYDQIHLVSYDEVTYWALGDIHMSLQILDNAYYPGAPYQIDFGETADNKGCMIVNVADATTFEFVPLVCPYPLVSVETPIRDWPEFSKYVGKEDVALPNHVIRDISEPIETVVQTMWAQVPPLWGLEELLNRQLEPEMVPIAVKLAEKLLEEQSLKTI